MILNPFKLVAKVRASSKDGPRTGTTLLELFVVMSIIIFLSASLYQVLHSVFKSFYQARNKLDILMTIRLVMSGVRNDLRNATDKPEAKIIDKKNFVAIPIKDADNKDKAIVYMFDEEKHRLYRGEKAGMNEPNPDKYHEFMFDDGQILKFDFDSSYRDADAFAQSELTLDSKIWFKVTMKILFTEKFKSLSDEEKSKIAQDPNDPRVKTFFMMITPRRVNWLLQATQ